MSNNYIYPDKEINLNLNLKVKIKTVGGYGVSDDWLSTTLNEMDRDGSLESLLKEIVSGKLVCRDIDESLPCDEFDRLIFEVEEVK